VQDDTAEQLHIIRYHIPYLFLAFDIDLLADHPLAGLFDGSKSFRQDIIQGFSLFQSDLEFFGFGFYLFVRKCFIFLIESIDRRYQGKYLIDLFLIVISGDKLQNTI
jgi:hypothetical protein